MTTTAMTSGVKLTAPATDALKDLAEHGSARNSSSATPRADARWVNSRIAKALVAKKLAVVLNDDLDIGITPAGQRYLLGHDPLPTGDTPDDTPDVEELDLDAATTLLGDELPPEVEQHTEPASAPGPAGSALAPPARYVVEIPIDELHPAATNRAVRDIEGLAASIAVDGVLQPLLVRTDPGSGYEIIAGARRHAAARIAGLPTVPCLIEDRAAAAVEFARLVENLQRAELTALEEADAYARLVGDFKLTQTDIAARVGRSEAHVSKRLSLRVLPDEAKVALDDGRINIQTALGITGLTKHPDRLALVLNVLPDADAANGDLERQRQTLDGVLAAQLRNADRDRLRAQVIAELEKTGDTIVPYPKWGQWSSTDYRVCHKGEEAEAYSVDDDGHTVKLTTQPVPDEARHATVPGKKKPPKGETAAQRATREAAEAAQQALDDLRDDAARRRSAIVSELLDTANNERVLAEYVLDSINTLVLDNGGDFYCVVNDAQVSEALNLPDDTPLRVYAGRTHLTRLRTAAAVVLLTAEDTTEMEERGAKPLDHGAWLPAKYVDQCLDIRRYLGLLQEHGYELTDEEHDALTTPEVVES